MKNKLISFGIPALALALIVALVLFAIAQNNSREKDAAVAVTVPVELTAAGVTDRAALGVIVTVGDSAAEGSQWNQAASGAQVALERFTRGAAKISLVTEDDRGTEAGAREAVEKLAEQNVSGIVLATNGAHTRGALEAAQEAGIPVLMPYQEATGRAWSLAPSNADLATTFNQETAKATKVFAIDQANHASLGVNAAETFTYKPGDNANELAQKIAEQTNRQENKNQEFAVVVNADASTSANLMRALQGASLNAKILFGNEVTSPAFSKALVADGDTTLAINAKTAGYNFDDAVALQANGQGRSMSSYLQMINIMSDSDRYTSLLGDQTFSEVAVSADSRSHDAVVVLVRAIEKANSRQAKDVYEALKTLTLTPADGITGAGYDFSNASAATGETVILYPSQGELVSRTSGNAENQQTRIVWFSNN